MIKIDQFRPPVVAGSMDVDRLTSLADKAIQLRLVNLSHHAVAHHDVGGKARRFARHAIAQFGMKFRWT